MGIFVCDCAFLLACVSVCDYHSLEPQMSLLLTASESLETPRVFEIHFQLCNLLLQKISMLPPTAHLGPLACHSTPLLLSSWNVGNLCDIITAIRNNYSSTCSHHAFEVMRVGILVWGVYICTKSQPLSVDTKYICAVARHFLTWALL